MERFSSLRESMRLRESKESTLRKCVNLTQEQKDEALAFFNGKGQSFWSSIDWNKPKDVTWEDIQSLMQKAENTASAQKKKVKNNQTLGLDTIELGKDYEVKAQGEDWILYHPLTHKGACILASNEVEPKVRNHVPTWAHNVENEWYNSNSYDEVEDISDGAHWCISMFKDKRHWDGYKERGTEFYILLDFKATEDKFKKVCYEVEGNSITCWNGDDRQFSPMEPFYEGTLISKMVDIIDPPPTEEQARMVEGYFNEFLRGGKDVGIESDSYGDMLVGKKEKIGGKMFITTMKISSVGGLHDQTHEECVKMLLSRGVSISISTILETGTTVGNSAFNDVKRRMSLFKSEMEEGLKDLRHMVRPSTTGTTITVNGWKGLDKLLDAYAYAKGKLDDILTRDVKTLREMVCDLMTHLFPDAELKSEDWELPEKFQYSDDYVTIKAVPVYFRDETGDFGDFSLMSHIEASDEVKKYIGKEGLTELFISFNVVHFESSTFRITKSTDGYPTIISTITLNGGNAIDVSKGIIKQFDLIKTKMKERTEERKEYESSGKHAELEKELAELGDWINSNMR